MKNNQMSPLQIKPNTVECRYNAVKYNMILHTSLQWLRQSIDQSLNPQNIFVGIWEKIDRAITASHCMMYVLMGGLMLMWYVTSVIPTTVRV